MCVWFCFFVPDSHSLFCSTIITTHIYTFAIGENASAQIQWKKNKCRKISTAILYPSGENVKNLNFFHKNVDYLSHTTNSLFKMDKVVKLFLLCLFGCTVQNRIHKDTHIRNACVWFCNWRLKTLMFASLAQWNCTLCFYQLNATCTRITFKVLEAQTPLNFRKVFNMHR